MAVGETSRCSFIKTIFLRRDPKEKGKGQQKEDHWKDIHRLWQGTIVVQKPPGGKEGKPSAPRRRLRAEKGTFTAVLGSEGGEGARTGSGKREGGWGEGRDLKSNLIWYRISGIIQGKRRSSWGKPRRTRVLLARKQPW